MQVSQRQTALAAVGGRYGDVKGGSMLPSMEGKGAGEQLLSALEISKKVTGCCSHGMVQK